MAKGLLDRGDDVIGFDCVSQYYGPAIKETRLDLLEREERAPRIASIGWSTSPRRRACATRLKSSEMTKCDDIVA